MSQPSTRQVQTQQRRPAAQQPAGQGKPANKPGQTFGDAVSADQRNLETAVAAQLLRNAAARENRAFLMRLNLILSGLLAFSVAANVAMGMRHPADHFFVENQAGQITSVVPLDQPVDSVSFVETWMTNALIQANTYDFANYRTMLQQSQQYFTIPGWNSWLTALQQSGNLDAVKQNKMVASATPIGAPVEVSPPGIVGGVYTWKFQIPIELTYSVLRETNPQQVLFIVTVVRVPMEDNASGLGIQSISFSSMNSGGNN